MKVMTVVGTRPEIIRLARVVTRLDREFQHILVHTGQNYDYTLNEVFFEELGLRRPDYYLDVEATSVGRVLGEVLIKSEEVMVSEEPDAVLVLGDTNSCIAALMAKRLQIPVFHMEAGNRCFDQNVPEETNRRMVDHVADYNLCYTEHARRNLLAEGLHPSRVFLTGSPMGEVLAYYRPQIEKSEVLDRLGLVEGEYFVVSAHRAENVDSKDRLSELLDCLEAVRNEWGQRVVVSTHPRTRGRLAAHAGRDRLNGLEFMEPFGFFDYNRLQLGARCVLSDSGTISEEASILRFPAVTLRDSIERPEALESGSIVTTGLSPVDVLRAIRLQIDGHLDSSLPAAYADQDFSNRVTKFVLSTVGRHYALNGIRNPSGS